MSSAARLLLSLILALAVLPMTAWAGDPIDLDAIKAKPPENTEAVDIGGPLMMKVEGKTVILFGDGGAVVKGIADVAGARALVAHLLKGA